MRRLSAPARPRCARWGAFRAHLPCGSQQTVSHHVQVRQRKERCHLRRVLHQSPVAGLYITKLALDHPQGVLHLGTDLCLDLFELPQARPQGGGGQRTALARPHGHVPGDRLVLILRSLLHPLIARVRKDVGLLCREQCMRLGHIVDVGSGGDDCMRQPRFGIHPDVHLHAEVPVVALLGLHLGVAAAAVILGRARCRNQRGVDQRALLEQQPALGQQGIDLSQQPLGQAVFLQAVTETQNGTLVRDAVTARIQAREGAHGRHVVQGLLHRRIGKCEPWLHEVDAQHRLCRVGLLAPAGAHLRLDRLDQRNETLPRHHRVHLGQKRLPARALGAAAQSHSRQGLSASWPVSPTFFPNAVMVPQMGGCAEVP